MKVTGIIAEYNPFHNGHLHQYKQIRKKSAADFILVVMSGSFVQRGEPAIYDKYNRTLAALNAGADLVIELPAIFATSSAEDFASASVALLDRLGVVNELCFGSECGDLDALQEVAEVLACEPEAYRLLLRSRLSSGMSFPQARNAALLDWLAGNMDHPNENGQSQAPDEPDAQLERWNRLLAAPNNILGIEYLKALRKRNSSIKPVTIPRSGQGYHDIRLDDGFASASGIRSLLAGENMLHSPAGVTVTGTSSPDTAACLAAQVPADAAALYLKTTPVFPDDCSLLLNERLLTIHSQSLPFDTFADVSGELASRIEKQLLDFASFSERIGSLKTRQYTYTRISRALTHLLLDIRKEDVIKYRHHDYVPYARVLGFRRKSVPLLSAIKHHSNLPLITKTAAAGQSLVDNSLELFQKDLYCSHIYQAIVHQKSGVVPRNEYTQPIVII